MPKQFPFVPPTGQCPNLPFPHSVSRDPQVLYHGTSSTYESLIDGEGLRPKKSLFELAELEAIFALFRSIGWSGSSGASLPVLLPFSIQHDFAYAAGKPVFFAECAHRACLYASRDWAGGEVARAVRYCFRELWSYVRDDAVRQKHRADVQRRFDHSHRIGAAVPELPPSDISPLVEGLHLLNDVSLRAENASETFQYGVVYAVRFAPSDFSWLEANSSMGVACKAIVSPDSIVAKVRVPASYVHNSFLDFDYFDLPSMQGIVATLQSR